MRNRRISFKVLLVGGVAVLALLAQSPQPTCHQLSGNIHPGRANWTPTPRRPSNTSSWISRFAL